MNLNKCYPPPLYMCSGAYAGFSEGGCLPRSAKEANNPILLKVQSLQLSFRPAGVSLGGGGGPRPPCPPPAYAPGVIRSHYLVKKAVNPAKPSKSQACCNSKCSNPNL